jgi:hypothetical protein
MNIVLHAEDYQEKNIPWVCFSDSYPPSGIHVRLCCENKVNDPESMAVGYFILGTKAHPDQIHVIFGRRNALITHWRPLLQDLINELQLWYYYNLGNNLRAEPKLKKTVKLISLVNGL